jgi:oxygen-independent coproporphyrinogen-3 oxidase
LQKIPYILALDCSITLTQETRVKWQQFLKNCTALPFKQVSISSLRGSCQIINSFYHWLQEHCMNLGMNQYELYNFAYPGYESCYMQALWNHEIVKGFGVRAESYDGTNRIQNIRSVKNYIRCIENQQLPTHCSYQLTMQQKRVEQLLMGLRIKNGISHQMLYEGLNEQQRASLDLHITQLEHGKLVIQQNGRIILAPDGRGYEDTIVLQLTVY